MDYSRAAHTVLEVLRSRMRYPGTNQVGGLAMPVLQAHAKAYGAADPLIDDWEGDHYLPYYLKLAEGAWEHGAGQCDAQSQMAALLLAAYGAFPVDVMAVTLEVSNATMGHAFAVTGRPRLSNDKLQDPINWVPGVVCDSWQGFAYPAAMIKQRLWCGDFADPERHLAPAPGDPASFCSEGGRLRGFEVAARFESEAALPAEILAAWKDRLAQSL